MQTAGLKQKDTCNFVLGDRVTGEHLEGLLSDLREATLSGASVHVDGSAVSIIDTTAIQILLAAEKSQINRGQGFCLHPISDDFVHAMKLIGLGADAERWRAGIE